jgi:hypothetical protein
MPQRANDGGLLVIQPIRDWTCADCSGTGDLLRMDDAGPLCLACADLDHLVFLPAGDAALTRRATKASSLSAVVVRWSRARKRYERQGVLVAEQALADAEEQCASDEKARIRRRERDRARRASADDAFQAELAEEITRLFPGCPPARAAAVARHAGARGSGRVGRSAAGRALEEGAVTLAVIASIRHEDTEYDSLLMSGLPRDVARDHVRVAIDQVLASWRDREPTTSAPGRLSSGRFTGAQKDPPAAAPRTATLGEPALPFGGQNRPGYALSHCAGSRPCRS